MTKSPLLYPNLVSPCGLGRRIKYDNGVSYDKSGKMFQGNDVVFDRFEIIERIAFGAFAVIYKVFDKQTNKFVCLKVEISKDVQCSMLAHELKVGIALDSPFTCKMYEYFQNSEIKGVTMELLSDNLANIRRKRKNPPSISMLANITLGCLKGLIFIHNHDMIHSDVKPSNVAFRMHDNGYDVVTFDYGLTEMPGEDETVTRFRQELKRNPRYLSLHTQNTNLWTQKDDYIALIYTLADFWQNGLPWDGRTTHKLVLEIKDGYDMKKLLPDELKFLVDGIEHDEKEVCSQLESLVASMERNIEQELHYILDGPDPGLKPKLVKYVFEDNDKNKYKDQHSA